LINFNYRKSGEVFERQSASDLLDYVENAPIALQWLSETGHVLWGERIAHVPLVSCIVDAKQ
jgi:hypothetical protein